MKPPHALSTRKATATTSAFDQKELGGLRMVPVKMCFRSPGEIYLPDHAMSTRGWTKTAQACRFSRSMATIAGRGSSPSPKAKRGGGAIPPPFCFQLSTVDSRRLLIHSAAVRRHGGGVFVPVRGFAYHCPRWQ